MTELMLQVASIVLACGLWVGAQRRSQIEVIRRLDRLESKFDDFLDQFVSLGLRRIYIERAREQTTMRETASGVPQRGEKPTPNV
jgi:hypothetical protein